MASANVKKPCATCKKSAGVATCDGCQQSFCSKHFSEHRQKLSQQIDNIGQQHDLLRRDLDQHNTENSLLSRINKWEQESITKIQVAAEAARADLQELLNKNKKELKKSVTKITDELQSRRESDDYTEIDINKWTQQLQALRKMLESPSTIGIDENETPESTIRLISIRNQQQHRSPKFADESLQHRSPKFTDESLRHRSPKFAGESLQHRSPKFVDESLQHRSPKFAGESLQHRSPKFVDESLQHRSPKFAGESLQHRISAVEEPNSPSNERFDEIDGKARVFEERLVVTCCSDSRFYVPTIYGANRYSFGIHHIHFRIDKMGNSSIFFGVTAAFIKMEDAYLCDKTLGESFDLVVAVVDGLSALSFEKNVIRTGDEVSLTLDCDNRQIQLQHHRTNRLLQLRVDLNNCPFPWKTVIKLGSAGDSVRILQ